jgi:DNA-binding Lrp family transcriptional regulator
MRISLDQKIAGYPAIRVRELMRRTAGGPIMFRDIRRILQCSHIAAARVMKHLEKDGLITSVKGSIEPSTKGNALAMATAAPPLRRATASRLLADLIKRTRDLNADDTWAYRVRRIVVFGSYVRGSERPNDVDVACELCPRWESDRQRAEEQVRRRSRGMPFRNVLQWATWPRLEVYRYLRARSRGLSIHELEDWILQDADHRVIYEAKVPKCNPTKNSTSSQTSGRC